jgi:hypothetical protein
MLLPLVLAAVSATASDVWILRGLATSPTACGDRDLVWNADAVLLNATGEDATVNVLEVSNAGGHHSTTIDVPANESRDAGYYASDYTDVPMWVTHLDVPDGVAIDSRLEWRRNGCLTPGPPPPDVARGKIATPVFRRLIPAGTRTLYVGADLGVQNVRTNVGIYNDALVPATATVEFRRAACPAGEAVTRTVSIPPKTLIQTTLFEAPPQCLSTGTIRGWAVYATITVDQASLGYVVSLAAQDALDPLSPAVTIGFATAN